METCQLNLNDTVLARLLCFYFLLFSPLMLISNLYLVTGLYMFSFHEQAASAATYNNDGSTLKVQLYQLTLHSNWEIQYHRGWVHIMIEAVAMDIQFTTKFFSWFSMSDSTFSWDLSYSLVKFHSRDPLSASRDSSISSVYRSADIRLQQSCYSLHYIEV